MSASLADRLEPVQATLAELERELLQAAREDNEPGYWSDWADIHCALLSVRAVQGRDTRANRRPLPETLP